MMRSVMRLKYVPYIISCMIEEHFELRGMEYYIDCEPVLAAKYQGYIKFRQSLFDDCFDKYDFVKHKPKIYCLISTRKSVMMNF